MTNNTWRMILIVLVAFCGCVIFALSAHADIMWSDNFDDKPDGEMSCSLSGGACAAPAGYTYMYGDPENAPAQGATQITTAANNNNKVTGKNKRGFRINLPDKTFPDQENKLSVTWGSSHGKVYIQWDERDSRDWPDSSYQKLFRLPASNQTTIPEWKGRNFAIGFSPFNGKEGIDHLTWSNCRLGIEVSIGDWHTYEIMLDMPNQKAQLWVDGVPYGEKKASGINTSWTFSSFEIGGNQHTYPDNPDPGEYRDYDNVKVSTTYIGVNTDSTAPTVKAFDIPASSNSLTVNVAIFEATDNVGVTDYLITESAQTPSADDPSWSGSPWTEYVFGSAGSKTLYVWARDAAGNISSSLSDTVSITIVEYKGKHLSKWSESREIKRIGEVWAKRSQGRCHFVWVNDRNWRQIREAAA